MAELRVTSTGTIKLFESDDTSSVTIASPASLGGDRTITLPDANVDLTEVNTMPIANLDIDGGTDIGANIADSDLLIIDDGAGGTNRKTAASRLKTYVGAGAGAFDIANLDIDGGTDIGAAITDSDLFIIDDGAGGTNRKTAASRIKTYVGGALTSLDSADSTTNVANVTFDNVLSDTYSRYIIYIDTMMPATDGASLYFRFRKSDGSGGYTDESRTGYVYSVRHIRGSNEYNDSATSGSAQNFGRISGAVKNSTGEHGLKAIINLYRPGTRQSQDTMTYITADGTYRSHANDDSMSVPFYSACNNYHTDAMLGIKFYFDSGDIDDHKIRVYGVTT